MEKKFIAEEIVDYCISNSSLLSNKAIEIYQNSLNLEKGHMVIGEISGCLVRTLILLKKPTKILEMGTFTGFTTILLNEYAPESTETQIVTLEEDKSILKVIQELFYHEIVKGRVKLINEEAIHYLETNSDKYDLIFVDIRKECYYNKIDLLHDSLETEGLLVVDNALSGLSVLNPIKLWQHQSVEFNKNLSMDRRFTTMILPLRDGFTIAIKR